MSFLGLQSSEGMTGAGGSAFQAEFTCWTEAPGSWTQVSSVGDA